MNSPLYWTIVRIGLALVWLYQGAWHKLIAVAPNHLEIVTQAIPFMNSRLAIGLIGAGECAIAVAILIRIFPRLVAWFQVGILAAMNTMGILSASDQISDPVGMLLSNFVLVLAALGAGYHAHHTK